VRFAGPLLGLGGILIVWALTASRPEHPVTRLLYRRFRPVRVQAPAPEVVIGVIAWGIVTITLAGLLVAISADDITGVTVALASLGVGSLVILAITWSVARRS
jgi:hypothetical protein